MWTAERIRDLRRRYGESQEDFRKRFRVSVQALQAWEQGRGDPSGPVTVILDILAEQINEPAHVAET